MTNTTTKYCRTCALADPETLVCQLTGRTIDLDADFCSQHTTPDQLGTCAYCGQLFFGPAILERLEDGSFIELCHSCQNKFGTCQMCADFKRCKLTDESYMPRIPVMVIKTIQQGHMAARVQVVNPDRIDAICKAECKCWDGEGCARRDFGTCAKYNQKKIK